MDNRHVCIYSGRKERESLFFFHDRKLEGIIIIDYDVM